jgi:hypothetical protein
MAGILSLLRLRTVCRVQAEDRRVPPCQSCCGRRSRRRRRTWSASEPAGQGAQYGSAWLDLPAADFTTFRAASCRLLSPRQFVRVDVLYKTTAARIDEWIAEHRRQDSPGRADPAYGLAPSEDQLRGVLPLRLEDVGGPWCDCCATGSRATSPPPRR